MNTVMLSLHIEIQNTNLAQLKMVKKLKVIYVDLDMVPHLSIRVLYNYPATQMHTFTAFLFVFSAPFHSIFSLPHGGEGASPKQALRQSRRWGSFTAFLHVFSVQFHSIFSLPQGGEGASPKPALGLFHNILKYSNRQLTTCGSLRSQIT